MTDEAARPDTPRTITLDIPLPDARPRPAGPARSDAATARTPDAPATRPADPRPIVPRPVTRPAVPDRTPSAPAPVRPDTSVHWAAEPTIRWTTVAEPDTAPPRRTVRAPQHTPRWPLVVGVAVIPAAGVAGFLATVLSSTAPLKIVVFGTVGGFVIVKLAGPIRAVVAAVGAAVAKVDQR